MHKIMPDLLISLKDFFFFKVIAKINCKNTSIGKNNKANDPWTYLKSHTSIPCAVTGMLKDIFNI